MHAVRAKPVPVLLNKVHCNYMDLSCLMCLLTKNPSVFMCYFHIPWSKCDSKSSDMRFTKNIWNIKSESSSGTKDVISSLLKLSDSGNFDDPASASGNFFLNLCFNFITNDAKGLRNYNLFYLY